jgi:hypothetical protein
MSSKLLEDAREPQNRSNEYGDEYVEHIDVAIARPQS